MMIIWKVGEDLAVLLEAVLLVSRYLLRRVVWRDFVLMFWMYVQLDQLLRLAMLIMMPQEIAVGPLVRTEPVGMTILDGGWKRLKGASSLIETL